MNDRDGEFDEADDPTVIVGTRDADGEGEGDDRTVIVDPDPDAGADDRTVIIDEDDPTSIVAAGAAPVIPEPQAEPAGPRPGDEQSIRRVVRSRRLPREPLRPMPVPPGRHGPLLPGSGAGAIFTTEVRPVPAAVPEPPMQRPAATPKGEVRSVAVASRRSSMIALVTASASVLVSLVGLAWVVRAVLGL
jgi:hypothetical protein